MRRADPRRRDHRLRLAGLHRRQARRRVRLRARLGHRALRADARRPQARRPAEADPGLGPGGDRRGDGARRGRDDRQPRPQVPKRDRRATCRRSSSTRAAGSRSPSAVSDELAAVRGGARRRPRAARRRPPPARSCPNYGPAPDFVDTQAVVQHPDGKPLSIAELTKGQGGVVLIDFWTYTCINCIRTLPYVKSWDAEYRDHGLTVVGVHSPEFAVREGRRQRRRRDRRRRDPVPRGPGQRPRHLDRVRQPVLAGEVSDRRQRARSATRTSARAATRRPRTRSARCSPRPATQNLGGDAKPRGRRRGRRPRSAHARDLPRHGPRTGLGQRPPQQGMIDYGTPPTRPTCSSTSSPTGAPGMSARRPRRRTATRASSSASRRGGCSSSSAPEDDRASSRSCSTASRSRTPTPARTSAAATATISGQRLYASSTCPGPAATRSSCASRRDRGLRVHVRLGAAGGRAGSVRRSSGSPPRGGFGAGGVPRHVTFRPREREPGVGGPTVSPACGR